MPSAEHADSVPFDPHRNRPQETPPDVVSFPTNSVSKADLLSVRPDLARQIQAFDDGDLAHIADKVGDALAESYWIALAMILASHVADYEDTLPTEAYPSGPISDWETEAGKALDTLPPLTTPPHDIDPGDGEDGHPSS